MTPDIFIWIGIVLCVLQSGTFSGLNLALFGIGALELKARAKAGNEDAKHLFKLRQDSNFLLSTILWGNVGTNVLLTLLTDSVLAGVAGFAFATFVITFGGEIIPQAYFSRNALRMATLMRPVLRFWQFVLFPIAKPTGLFLDAWLGPDRFDFINEDEIRSALEIYTAASESEVSRVEGLGALNFFTLDDVAFRDEGELLDEKSIISVAAKDGVPIFPVVHSSKEDPFIKKLGASGRRWVVITSSGEPLRVLDFSRMLRVALFMTGPVDPELFCHHPVVVRDPATLLGEVIPQLVVERTGVGDNVIDKDMVFLWGEQKRILTGADLLGRLFHGIVLQKEPSAK
jgi:metal transporter CNNM